MSSKKKVTISHALHQLGPTKVIKNVQVVPPIIGKNEFQSPIPRTKVLQDLSFTVGPGDIKVSSFTKLSQSTKNLDTL